ncbi:translational activator of cytochrome c oxidase 1 [Ischnura elegans]|uniref:translational activator of cytochrome c oxidase 1 n=1 Tax=Ischnura elegans TaxID=197161 RepID=UPI001ED897E7|nr:translational activator of cytochrome c oxidase 1 [Ischnura elegans]
MANAATRAISFSLKKCFLNFSSPSKEFCRKYAGHSKWANIKHIKAAKDAERSALFERLSRQIRVAISDGGSPSPETNLLLARAVEQAKKLNMPAASIQYILKAAEKDSSVPRKQHLMELKGPGGFVMIVDILTSNLAKTKSEMFYILKKGQATMSEGVKFLFEKKGIIQATSLKSYPLDKVIENAIEGGADDVVEIEGDDGTSIFQFYSDPDVLTPLRNYLELKDYSVHFASVEYLPLNVIELDEAHAKIAEKLLQNLSNHPDVVAVYDNFS